MDVDLRVAQRAMRLSRTAYRAPDRIDRDLAGLELREMAFSTNRSTQAFTCRDDATMFVVFRGSEAIHDWVANARFLPTARERDVHIHTGFIDALDEVWEELSEPVSGAQLPVVVAGHSLGGALAVLAAFRLAVAGVEVAGVYTFGQPRTGHADFRRAYDDLLGEVTFRFVNHIDLVTRVPLLIQNYRHVGRRMYWDEDGKLHRDAGAWFVARDDLRFRLRNFGRISSMGLAPHLFGPYQERIDASVAELGTTQA